MLIDWFTVGAQVINFLILVWLLKRFLYHPILDAIDARERRIAQELADADMQKAEAAQSRDEFQRKNAVFDKERAALLNQATQAAQAERKRMLDVARQEAVALSAKRQETMRSEAQALHQEIRIRTQQEVFAIVRKALSDLAGATLEERMVDVFVGRLQALNADEKQALIFALQPAPLPLVVRSTFELPAAQQSAVEAQVKALLGSAIEVRFETSPNLVSGIELSSDGQKIAWSIANYLTELESGIGEVLKVQDAASGQGAADVR